MNSQTDQNFFAKMHKRKKKRIPVLSTFIASQERLRSWIFTENSKIHFRVHLISKNGVDQKYFTGNLFCSFPHTHAKRNKMRLPQINKNCTLLARLVSMASCVSSKVEDVALQNGTKSFLKVVSF